jgi:hypothetical protein
MLSKVQSDTSLRETATCHPERANIVCVFVCVCMCEESERKKERRGESIRLCVRCNNIPVNNINMMCARTYLINQSQCQKEKKNPQAHYKLTLPWLCLSVLGCNKIITRLITWLMSADRALEGQLSQLGITEEPLKE